MHIMPNSVIISPSEDGDSLKSSSCDLDKSPFGLGKDPHLYYQYACPRMVEMRGRPVECPWA